MKKSVKVILCLFEMNNNLSFTCRTQASRGDFIYKVKLKNFQSLLKPSFLTGNDLCIRLV